MKKIIAVTLALITVLLLCANLAGCGGDSRPNSYEDLFVFTLNDDGESYSFGLEPDNVFTKGLSADDPHDLVIPSEYEGKPVTRISEKAFYKCITLYNVTIPDTVTEIGDSAFQDCTVKTVNIPSSVKKIGKKAFFGCSLLSRTDITDIDAWCNIEFADATSNPGALYLKGEMMTELHISGVVSNIKDFAFYGCEYIEEIYFYHPIDTIGTKAFYNCKNLKIVDFLSPFIKHIAEDAFGFEYMSNIDVTVDRNFFFCGSFDEWNKVDNKDKSIDLGNKGSRLYFYHESGYDEPLRSGDYWEWNADRTERVIWHYTDLSDYFIFTLQENGTYSVEMKMIPEDMTEITVPSVYHGVKVTSLRGASYRTMRTLIISEGIERIGNLAIVQCPNLTEVYIPKSVTWFGYDIFDKEVNVFYGGSPADGEAVSLATKVSLAKIYYYDPEEQCKNIAGNYWKYGETGEVITWTVSE